MSKYYDKLIQINEDLDKELKGENVNPDSKAVKRIKDAGLSVGFNTKGIEVSYTDEDEQDCKDIFGRLIASVGLAEIVQGVTTEKLLGGQFVTYGTVPEEKLVTEDGGNDENTVEVSKDSLTPDQKKEILLDKGVDQKAVDNLKDDKALDGALDATLNNNEVKKESDGEVKVEDDIDESVIIRMDDDDLDMHGFVKKFENGELEWTNDEQEAERFQHEELGQNMIEAICTKFHYDPSTFTIKSVDPRADEPYEDDEEGQNWVSLDPMHPGATTLP